MSFIPTERGSAEWNKFPGIGDLLDPVRKEHPERLLKGKMTMNDLLRSCGSDTPQLSLGFLSMLGRYGLVLDVSCGIYTAKTETGGFTTPVGSAPNAYGIDPAFDFFPQGHVEGRTIAGYAEDMPFKDRMFGLVLSMRGLGYYAGDLFDPYWSIREMVRVTDGGGTVYISMGSGGKNNPDVVYKEITEAISRLRSESFGQERIDDVLDCYYASDSQINIGVK